MPGWQVLARAIGWLFPNSLFNKPLKGDMRKVSQLQLVTAIQRWLCLVGLIFMTSASVATELVSSASDGSWALFQKMVANTSKHNFRGVFLFSNGTVLSSMQVVHRWQDGEVRERLLQLDGEMGEILREGTKVICILPNANAVNVYESGFSSPFSQVSGMAEKLAANYHLSSAGEDRVAGIMAEKLYLRAVDTFRYSYQLWINKTDGFLLKYLLHDETGTELERFQYTQLELDVAISDEELKPTVVGATKVHELPVPDLIPSKMVNPAAIASDWHVDWLPPGFAPVQDISSDSKYDTQVFSDGLASFSVFVVRVLSGEGMPEGGTTLGATTAYSRKVTHAKHQYDVTIVGEIPPLSAMKVAASVTLKN